MKTKASFFTVGMFLAVLVNCIGQTSVHRFGRMTALPDQTVTLELLGDAPTAFSPYFDIYVLETSTDLMNWTPLPTLLRTNNSTSALVFTDSVASSRTRFYRTFTNHLITPFSQPDRPLFGGHAFSIADGSVAHESLQHPNQQFVHGPVLVSCRSQGRYVACSICGKKARSVNRLP